jgi:hypothetical protein
VLVASLWIALVAATGCGGGTDRPADSLIPTSARWLEVTVTQRSSPLRYRSKERTLRTVVATNPAIVHAVADAVNALPRAHPEGPVASCPIYSPPFVHLTFRTTASSAALARVLIDTEECGRAGGATAWINTVNDRTLVNERSRELTDSRAPNGRKLIDHIEAALGHRLHLR